MTRFPDDFLFGVATAAYQIEGGARDGGRAPSIWDTFSHTPGNVLHGDTGDVACDHYHRWREDVDLMADLGVNAYRFSIAWPRVLPNGTGTPNTEGLDFYQRLVDALLDKGIAPAITLYHWDLPQALEDRGGWLNRDCASWFAEYAATVFGALGDRVPYWITLNEPIAASFHGYGTRHAAPGLSLGGPAVAASHHLLLAHAGAVEAHRAAGLDSKIGITVNFGPVAPATDDPADVAAADRLDTLQTRWFADALFTGAYPANLVDFYRDITDFDFIRPGDLDRISAPIDFLGVNYYKSWVGVATDLPEPEKRTAMDLGAEARVPPGREVTGFGWAICPDELARLLRLLTDRYDRLPPLYVTENGCAYDDYADPTGQVRDTERIDFLARYLDAAADAVADGVNLRGYFAWSLLDNFEWGDGYRRRFGLVHVDYPTGRRLPKASYHWYRDMIRKHRADR